MREAVLNKQQQQLEKQHEEWVKQDQQLVDQDQEISVLKHILEQHEMSLRCTNMQGFLECMTIVNNDSLATSPDASASSTPRCKRRKQIRANLAEGTNSELYDMPHRLYDMS